MCFWESCQSRLWIQFRLSGLCDFFLLMSTIEVPIRHDKWWFMARNSFIAELLTRIIKEIDEIRVSTICLLESRHGGRNSYDYGKTSVWRESKKNRPQQVQE